MKAILGLTFAAATMAAAALISGPVQAAAHSASSCGESLESPRPAFNGQGERFGTVIATIKDDSGEPSGYVLQRDGFMYGYQGGSHVLPAEYVEFAAGRAKILLQDPSAITSFPDHAC